MNCHELPWKDDCDLWTISADGTAGELPQSIHNSRHVGGVCRAVNDAGFCEPDSISVRAPAGDDQTIAIPFNKDVGHCQAYSDLLDSRLTRDVKPRKLHSGAAHEEKQALVTQDPAFRRGFTGFSGIAGVAVRKGFRKWTGANTKIARWVLRTIGSKPRL